MNPRTLNEAARVLPEITSIVHDLRNPLSTIHGGAEILISARLSESQVRRIVRSMYGASIHMRELLDEVLTRFRGTDKGAEPSDLGELVTSAVNKVAVVAEAQSVEVVLDVPEELVIPLDRQRIQRVLVNLLVNALDVMPDGGTIRMSALVGHHSVQIKVRDTGPGIAPEIRDRIFQPFVTAGKARGFGLGLALSRQAVVDHGGRMWLESGSTGACFAFSLPRTGRPSPLFA
jgi:signal transduction histidine kinase